jgi:hypothetical protein
MTDKIPAKRCGTTDEIAAMVSFIASKEVGAPPALAQPDGSLRLTRLQASFTTGFTFDASGGRAVY